VPLRPVAGLTRTAIACACAWSVAWPVSAADRRPYEGPLQIEAFEREPPPLIELVDLDANADAVSADASDGDASDGDASDGDASDDDATDVDATDDLEPRDWRDEPEGESVAKRLRGGILLTTGGLALVLGAVVIGSVDPCVRLTGNGCQAEAARRAALTMGIPGAAILAAGATFLGLGLTQRRRLQRNLVVGPDLGRHGAGVTLVGRF
jgi:hypothetical protein